MVDKITSLLRDRGDSLFQEDGLLAEKEFQILREVFLPDGMSLCYIPRQKTLGRKRQFHEVNPTLRAAVSRLSSRMGVMWGYVDAYVAGLEKIEAYIGSESRKEHSYVSREERRASTSPWWVD